MIKIKKNNDSIIISGHANYSSYGTDIVCASVSSIITTVVNCIMNIDRDSINYIDDGESVTITKNNSNAIVEIILNTMMDLLLDLERQYQKNIKIESEE